MRAGEPHLPCQDVVVHRRSSDSRWGIVLESPEVAHQASPRRGRHAAGATGYSRTLLSRGPPSTPCFPLLCPLSPSGRVQRGWGRGNELPPEGSLSIPSAGVPLFISPLGLCFPPALLSCVVCVAWIVSAGLMSPQLCKRNINLR